MQPDAGAGLGVDLHGFEVLHLGIGAVLVDLFAYGPSGDTAQLRFEAAFELQSPEGASQVLDPGGVWDPLAALFVLRNDTIGAVRVTGDSELRVEFHSGHVITSSPDGAYEAWEIHAPGGVLVIGRAGQPVMWSDL